MEKYTIVIEINGGEYDEYVYVEGKSVHINDRIVTIDKIVLRFTNNIRLENGWL